MEKNTLENLRFVTPPFILIVFVWLVGVLTDLWDAPYPKSFKEFSQSWPYLVLGVFYYVLPFRNWANARHFGRVTENLRSRMVQISKLEDDKKLYSWQQVRGFFFHLVDNDKSLTIKSKSAYFNGYLWTSVADFRVFSYAFAVFTAASYFLNFQDTYSAPMIFLALALVSHVISTRITDRHISIGNAQLEIIELLYSNKVKSTFEGMNERASTPSD